MDSAAVPTMNAPGVARAGACTSDAMSMTPSATRLMPVTFARPGRVPPRCDRFSDVPGELLEFKRVDKWFGDLHVLQEIDLAARPGEVVVIIGPSGSGRS